MHHITKLGVKLAHGHDNLDDVTANSVYEFQANDIDGNVVDMEQFRNKVTLFVNVATKWGATNRNYKELNEIYDQYHDKGFEIVAFPCNQFLHQEPGTNAEIASFARDKKGVQFLMMEKIEVNGPGAHPLWRYLKKATDREPVNWNFAKYLVDKHGNVKHYESNYFPHDISKDIQAALV